MANTYTQLYIHIIFAVKYRWGLIGKEWKDELYKYITGTIEQKGHKLYAINGMSDHIHILVSISPTESISDLVRDIKRASSLWINENKMIHRTFAWQEGYSAFSYNQSSLGNVVNYIQHQKEHHRHRSFREECMLIYEKYNIDYDERYIFADPI